MRVLPCRKIKLLKIKKCQQCSKLMSIGRQNVLFSGLTNNNFFYLFPVLAILPYLLNGQVSLDAIQNYRAIEAAYARELIRPTGIATPFDSQITFVQQVTSQRSCLLVVEIEIIKNNISICKKTS